LHVLALPQSVLVATLGDAGYEASENTLTTSNTERPFTPFEIKRFTKDRKIVTLTFFERFFSSVVGYNTGMCKSYRDQETKGNSHHHEHNGLEPVLHLRSH
jgi:hypothetical protein